MRLWSTFLFALVNLGLWRLILLYMALVAFIGYCHGSPPQAPPPPQAPFLVLADDEQGGSGESIAQPSRERERARKPVKKTRSCGCSPLCTCGCQQGEECTCHQSSTPTPTSMPCSPVCGESIAAPVYTPGPVYAPAYSPAMGRFSAPRFLSGGGAGFGGFRSGGGNCGPGG